MKEPYLFDIKWVMKELKSKEAGPTEPSACTKTCPFTRTEKWWHRSLEAGSPPIPDCCVWALDQQQRLTEDFAACI